MGSRSVRAGSIRRADRRGRSRWDATGPRQRRYVARGGRSRIRSVGFMVAASLAMATPAWSTQAGFNKQSIFGNAPPRGQAMRTLLCVICALGAASLFAGITCLWRAAHHGGGVVAVGPGRAAAAGCGVGRPARPAPAAAAGVGRWREAHLSEAGAARTCTTRACRRPGACRPATSPARALTPTARTWVVGRAGG